MMLGEGPGLDARGCLDCGIVIGNLISKSQDRVRRPLPSPGNLTPRHTACHRHKQIAVSSSATRTKPDKGGGATSVPSLARSNGLLKIARLTLLESRSAKGAMTETNKTTQPLNGT